MRAVEQFLGGGLSDTLVIAVELLGQYLHGFFLKSLCFSYHRGSWVRESVYALRVSDFTLGNRL